MAFTSSNTSTGFKVSGRVEKIAPNPWPAAIDYAHEFAWNGCVDLFLIANGLEPNPDGNNAEKMQQLWELSKGKIEARNCDFNDINLLEDYEGEIPTGSTGKPAARFNMIGLMTGGKKGESGAYRKEFVDYLQQSRIPKGTVLLCFPARRGEKDGKFNLVLTHEK
tara:strand:- start:64 stop:558 length:495 start_codon:yes stop_codon:yes gene_type:complete